MTAAVALGAVAGRPMIAGDESLSAVLEAWTEQQRADGGLSKSSARFRRSLIMRFARHLGADPRYATGEQAEEFLDHVANGKTRSSYSWRLALWFEFLARSGRIRAAPIASPARRPPRSAPAQQRQLRPAGGPIAEYLQNMAARGCAHLTMCHVQAQLLSLQEWAGQPLLSLDHQTLTRYQRQRAQAVQPDTLRSQIGRIRGFYQWALMEGLVDLDPTRRLVLPRKAYRLPRPIREDRLQVALERVAEAEGRPEQMTVILCLAAFLGFRAIEIARAAWEEVDLSAGTLRIIGKGDRERIAPLPPIVVQALVALPYRSGPVVRRADGRAGHVDPNRISQMSNRYLRAVGIPDTLHALRHRFGTQVYKLSKDLRATQVALGHASVANTQKYTEVADDVVRAAVFAAGSLMPALHG